MTKRIPFPVMVYVAVAILAFAGLFLIPAFRAFQLREENAALQARITAMQKRTDEMQQRIDKQEREKRLCADLAKFSRGILVKQREACEAKVEGWVRGACSEPCLRAYTTLSGMQQILAEGAIEFEALQRKHQAEREARQTGEEGRRAIEKLEAEQKAGGKP